MRERRVVAFDRQDRLVRVEQIAVEERVHRQRIPVVGAELQDRDRLVHAAEVCVVLLEHLQNDDRAAAVAQQRGTGVVEVRVV